MKDDIKRSLVALPASPDVTLDEYNLGFYVIGYERRSRFIASKLTANTGALCAFRYNTDALAFNENNEWANEHGVLVRDLDAYRLDHDHAFHNFVRGLIEEQTRSDEETRIFVDVSSMDRSLIARLLNSVFLSARPPFTVRLCYAPALFVEPSYAFVPARECAPAIPELSGGLGVHQSNRLLVLGLGFEYGVALGLLEQFEPNRAIIFMPTGTDDRFDRAVKKANFDFDFGIENMGLFKYRVNQPVAVFESLYSLTADASKVNRVIIAPNGPKIFAALATVIGLFRAPRVTILRASLAAQPPSRHVDANGSIVAIDFHCSALQKAIGLVSEEEVSLQQD